jgi:hypothetical protein
MSSAAQPNSRVSSTISEQRDTAYDQLAATWQRQLDRIEEALSTGWQEHIRRVFDERFDELTARVERDFQAELVERVAAEVAAASPQIRERVKREAAEDLNRAVRRLAEFESEGQWAAAVLDSIAGFCSRAVLLTVAGEKLKVVRVRGPEQGAPAAGLEVAFSDAPAVASVVNSREASVTLTAEREISSPLAAFFEAGGMSNCAVVPVPGGKRCAAVLIAAGEPMEVNGLEAIAAVAGSALERRAPEPVVAIEQTEAQLRAERFARVRAAEIRLYKAQAVLDGRAHKNLYAELKEEIDSARAAYRRDYLRESPTLPDYLHQELLRTLANDEVAALGEDYPGPLA